MGASVTNSAMERSECKSRLLHYALLLTLALSLLRSRVCGTNFRNYFGSSPSHPSPSPASSSSSSSTSSWAHTFLHPNESEGGQIYTTHWESSRLKVNNWNVAKSVHLDFRFLIIIIIILIFPDFIARASLVLALRLTSRRTISQLNGAYAVTASTVSRPLCRPGEVAGLKCAANERTSDVCSWTKWYFSAISGVHSVCSVCDTVYNQQNDVNTKMITMMALTMMMVLFPGRRCTSFHRLSFHFNFAPFFVASVFLVLLLLLLVFFFAFSFISPLVPSRSALDSHSSLSTTCTFAPPSLARFTLFLLTPTGKYINFFSPVRSIAA